MKKHLLAILLFSSGMAAHSAAFAAPQFDPELFEGKVVVVDFWASWCVPCRRSFPWLSAMQDKYRDDGLVVIGVNLDAERADADAFIAEYSPNFQIQFDVDKQLARQFGVEAMPVSYIFGRDGVVHATHYGFKVKKQVEYEAVLVDLLQQTE